MHPDGRPPLRDSKELQIFNGFTDNFNKKLEAARSTGCILARPEASDIKRMRPFAKMSQFSSQS